VVWTLKVALGRLLSMEEKSREFLKKLKLVSRLSPFAVIKSLWKVGSNTIFYFLAFICGTVEVSIFYFRQKFLGYKLPNYHTVLGDTLYRGGQPSNSGLRELGKRGIKTIINLRVGGFNKKVIEEYYSDQIRAIHLPFYPYGPQDKIMIEFLKILLNPSCTPAFVHCFHGADRTGAVVAIYRIIVENWDKEKAIAEMKRKGLHWWHKNLIEYIHNLDIDHIRDQVGLSARTNG